MRDVRAEQRRDAITSAWKIWRAQFNQAVVQTQSTNQPFAKGFGTKGE